MMHSPVQIPVCVYKRESLMLVSNDRAFSLSFRHDHVWNIKGTLAGLRTAMIEVVARVPPKYIATVIFITLFIWKDRIRAITSY